MSNVIIDIFMHCNSQAKRKVGEKKAEAKEA